MASKVSKIMVGELRCPMGKLSVELTVGLHDIRTSPKIAVSSCQQHEYLPRPKTLRCMAGSTIMKRCQQNNGQRTPKISRLVAMAFSTSLNRGRPLGNKE